MIRIAVITNDSIKTRPTASGEAIRSVQKLGAIARPIPTQPMRAKGLLTTKKVAVTANTQSEMIAATAVSGVPTRLNEVTTTTAPARSVTTAFSRLVRICSVYRTEVAKGPMPWTRML